jgi:hypothetical protein
MQFDGPMLTRRRIEAEIIKPVYEEMCERLGIEKAREIITAAIRKSAIAEGKAFAAKVGERSGIEGFMKISSQWGLDDALQTEMIEHDGNRLVEHVTGCRYAEMYRDMGLGELGFLLSCNRDGVFCEGFDDRIKMTRTQTIMQGAAYCDFTYELIDDEE